MQIYMMKFAIVIKVFLICLVSSLLACQSMGLREPEFGHHKGEGKTVVATPVAANSVQQRTVVRLLRAAERAVEADRLSTPMEDNALDRYRAVLLLDPENERAQLGLNDIVRRYLLWARTDLQRDNLTRAALTITRALEVDKNNLQALSMADEIRQRVGAVLASRPQAARENEWPIDKERLTGRHPRLIAKLAVLAERLKLSGESMLIVTRNDKEGRWVYRQMQAAVKGYRLRGDIQLGRNPKIIILPAL